MEKYAGDFSPTIRWMYNGTGAVIPRGTAISRSSTVAAIADAASEDGNVTTPVFPAAVCNSAAAGREQNFIGIAQEATSAGDWVPVITGGPAQALTNTAITATVGMGLNPGTTLGAFIESTTPHAIIACTVLVAQTTTATADAYVDVFVEDSGLKGGNGLAYL